MKFGSAIVKSIKADVHKKEITISFALSMQYLGVAEVLAHYIGEDKGDVILEVTPRQKQLNLTMATIGSAERIDEEEEVENG